jgi:deazaflavin-dependent oxidoreductase (nitroreductase family)
MVGMNRIARRAAMLAGRLLRVRWVVRAPIWLFRARLGLLFGKRMLMLEHIGRKTGARRYVVLEVVAHPNPRTYVVASGFGERAQWLRNVRSNPNVRVVVGSAPPQPATARVLDQTEARSALETYARSHPIAWRSLRPVFESTLGTQISDDGTELPLVGLTLHPGAV